MEKHHQIRMDLYICAPFVDIADRKKHILRRLQSIFVACTIPANQERLVQAEVRDMDHALAAAVRMANIPSLLAMLVQLTGDEKWINDPYRPVRPVGVDDNDGGGLDPAIQDEIRNAAMQAVLGYKLGVPVAYPHLPPELAVRILASAMSEPIPLDYAPIIEAYLPDTRKLPDARLEFPPGFHVLIVGAGISGIGLAVNLQAAGVPFTIVERSDDTGGVWRENAYPGAGVDTPNHIYGYSFASNDWSMYYALREEIKAYLDGVVEQFGLRRYIRFGTKLESAQFDAGASVWDAVLSRPDGGCETMRPNVLVSCVGAFSVPKYPPIPGLADFSGVTVHTASWPSDLDIEGKRVAMIGNGASAMQVGPEIHRKVASLTVFQREPQWVAPTSQFRKPIPEPLRLLIREVPYYRAWYRLRLAWTFGDRLHTSLQKDPAWPHPERSLNRINDAHRAFFADYLERELAGRPDLIAKSLPAYPPYAKRMLMDNGWFRMLRHEHVTLVIDPVVGIEGDRLVTAAGEEYPVDILVLATGFDMRFLTSYSLKGRSGRTLREAWDDIDARAYIGTTVPNFPNFLCLYGPNLQLGHGGSWIEIVEMQIRYVMDMLRRMADEGIAEFECREDVFEAYDRELREANDRMVWTHQGMSTYFRNSHGRVTVNSPLRMTDLFRRLSAVDTSDFHLKKRETTR